jgi:3-oxoacyl-[acyl-carrier-protein] synthase III
VLGIGLKSFDMKLTNNFLLLPSNTVAVEGLLSESGRDFKEIHKAIQATGIESLHYVRNKSLSEFVLKGLSSFASANQSIFLNIDAIIVVSQTFDNRIPSLSTRIQKTLGLPRFTFCVDIIDGCAGFIKAISLVDMLQQKGLFRALVIAGDMNSMITEKADISTKVLFGDGVSMSILEPDDKSAETILCNDGDVAGLISCHIDDEILQMNGFEVFRFTRNNIPNFIRQYLAENSIELDSYDLIGMHQASKLIVSTLCSSLGVQNKYTENFNCGKIGNLGAGSIGAWLANIEGISDENPRKMLAVGFGAGLSWGLASFTVQLERNEVGYVDC